jgi:hypothetical protein
MESPLSSQDRLKILQTVDNLRRWSSLDDKRLCAICDRVIYGHQIQIRRERDQYTLHCPTNGCPSNFSHWFLYHAPAVGGTDGTVPSKVPTGTVEMSFLFVADR